MLETKHGEFELIKNFREAFVMDDFNNRYVDVFNVYKYVVGDYSAGMLRFKGFTEGNHHTIPDYIIESCAPNCAYYILMNPKFDPNLNRNE